jgi:cyclopropane-fatty-acyl-phospholipid synthase
MRCGCPPPTTAWCRGRCSSTVAHRELLDRIASWLEPDGVLFVHIFSHARYAYLYEAQDASDWMSEHFFTGGMMPADSLLPLYQGALQLEAHWRLDGEHYAKTARAWLSEMDSLRSHVRTVLGDTYGRSHVRRWWVRWRIFFMACAELFGYREGHEWLVSHYRFRRP